MICSLHYILFILFPILISHTNFKIGPNIHDRCGPGKGKGKKEAEEHEQQRGKCNEMQIQGFISFVRVSYLATITITFYQSQRGLNCKEMNIDTVSCVM